MEFGLETSKNMFNERKKKNTLVKKKIKKPTVIEQRILPYRQRKLPDWYSPVLENEQTKQFVYK